MSKPTDDVDAFLQMAPRGRPLLGLDLGSKNIGVAVCDPGWMVASPNATLVRSTFRTVASKIREVAEDRNAGAVVIGLPRNMNGTEGPKCQSARAFAANLARSAEAPVLLWDERLSTVEAERSLIDAGASRKRRREVLDKVAASIILQGAIDRLRHAGGAE